MATLRRVAFSGLLFSLVLIVAMSGHPQGEVTLFGDGQCRSVAVCQENMDLGPAVAEMLADQVAILDSQLAMAVSEFAHVS